MKLNLRIMQGYYQNPFNASPQKVFMMPMNINIFHLPKELVMVDLIPILFMNFFLPWSTRNNLTLMHGNPPILPV